MELDYKRYKFIDIFDESPDGSLTPKFTIEINGVRFSPGVKFQKGVVFGGVDFHLYKYRDIAIIVNKDESENDLYDIKGFYKENNGR